MKLPRTVVALGLVSLLTDASSEMIYPLLPLFLTTTLGASAVAIGAIEGVAESVAALLKWASGWWSDRLGRRKPLVVLGYGLASVARPLIGVAQSVGQVLALRVTDRIGKGIRTAPRDALISDVVDPGQRGQAFGFHRAADHAGAVIGPLLATALLAWAAVSLRTVFLLAAVPALLAMLVLVFGVRETRTGEVQTGDGRRETGDEASEPSPPAADPSPPLGARRSALGAGSPVLGAGRPALGAPFWRYLAVLFLFTLGNSTDAFLLLRAHDLGVPVVLAPMIWALLHVVKSAANTPGGALSDRLGRRPLIVSGWTLYAAVYLGFALASDAWHAWALFAVYGVYFGLTEGTEKALVADLVPRGQRGAAYGWFNLAIALGALPASLIFGAIWQTTSPALAFLFGASVAVAAAILLLLLVHERRPA
jgi:MFS family permease